MLQGRGLIKPSGPQPPPQTTPPGAVVPGPCAPGAYTAAGAYAAGPVPGSATGPPSLLGVPPGVDSNLAAPVGVGPTGPYRGEAAQQSYTAPAVRAVEMAPSQPLPPAPQPQAASPSPAPQAVSPPPAPQVVSPPPAPQPAVQPPEEETGPAGGGSKASTANNVQGLAGADAETSQVDDGTATTLILRNLPTSFNQQAAQEWVDAKGYQGLYDFLLWFPAKKTSRLNTSSYAFVNFWSASDAHNFRQEFHLVRFQDQGKTQWPLSIAVAKVQGFVENYVRFHHLLEDNSPTLCLPFFDDRAVAALSQESIDAAAAAGSNMPHPDPSQDGPSLTLIVRNLPPQVENQEVARSWLDKKGFEGQYDFFSYFPAKRRRPGNGPQVGTPQGLGYAFVNFRDSDLAQNCVEQLNGKVQVEGDPPLSVVAARVQGFDECRRHFSSLSESGRVVPWVDPVVVANRPPRQYQ
mmetsp:Transcript_89540/g.191870  ORF Transcript_89540/g.191870 Transcript_89540/m.191870 type:complete len:463 (+) Transcript_89540:2-1390(+)